MALGRDDQTTLAATKSASRAMHCSRPLSAPYSLMTRSRSAADGNSPRQTMRVRPPRSSKITVWRNCTGSTSLRRHDLFEGDAVLVVAAVGAPPNAARPEIETGSGRGEAERSPPLRQMLWIGPGGEDQRPRRVEFARADDRSRIVLKIDAACCGDLFCSSRLRGHGYAPQHASGQDLSFAAFADRHPSDRNSRRKNAGND